MRILPLILSLFLISCPKPKEPNKATISIFEDNYKLTKQVESLQEENRKLRKDLDEAQGSLAVCELTAKLTDLANGKAGLFVHVPGTNKWERKDTGDKKKKTREAEQQKGELYDRIHGNRN